VAVDGVRADVAIWRWSAADACAAVTPTVRGPGDRGRRASPPPVAAARTRSANLRWRCRKLFDTVLASRIPCGRAAQEVWLSFLFLERRRDIDSVLELGASCYLSTPSYQLDRGLFENFLGTRCGSPASRSSTAWLCAASNSAGEHDHRVRCDRDGASLEIDARWS